MLPCFSGIISRLGAVLSIQAPSSPSPGPRQMLSNCQLHWDLSLGALNSSPKLVPLICSDTSPPYP